MALLREKIISVEELAPFEDEYVYDLIMRDGSVPYFFANDVLVHNSCYFAMDKIVSTPDEAVECADAVAGIVNEAFPDFMKEAFLCQPEFSDKIKAARETVAKSAIFRAKKKYMLFVYDLEGKKIDPNSAKALKTQGSDIKISSTPETIREMLKEVTMMILKGEDRKKIDDYVIEFRGNMKVEVANPLDFATVTSVKTFDEYYAKWQTIEKKGLGRTYIPPNVRAAINHNHFVESNGISDERLIKAGDKIKLVWLKENDWGFTNFAFSSDIEMLPDWFTKNFEVDLKATEQKLIDQKVGNIFQPLGWEVPTLKTQLMHKLVEF